MKTLLFFVIILAEMIFSVFQLDFYFGNSELLTVILYVISYIIIWVAEGFKKFRTDKQRENFMMFGSLTVFGILIMILFVLKLILIAVI
ncbi:MAG: hypothetical protein NC340_08440 [Ruminococcus flavefaciens]|nr:hypothetical protein [Ruminococcus flavefaciens]MCM1229899.1 hypothetical protein [Ruminococcus flavefaciens]